jgi:hypothetical protein
MNFILVIITRPPPSSLAENNSDFHGRGDGQRKWLPKFLEILQFVKKPDVCNKLKSGRFLGLCMIC